MKLGFIGAGNMAQGIIKGLISTNKISSDKIIITASTPSRSQLLAKELGVTSASSNTELVAAVDIVILATKPYLLPEILSGINTPELATNKLFISIAAGLTLDSLSAHLPLEQKIIRVMPNMNISIGHSVSAICGNDYVSKHDIAQVIDLFETVGSAYEVSEKDFSNFTSLAGCSPAYTYLYIDAMSRSGVKNGLPKKLATKIAAEAVLGSAKMVLESLDETPWDLIDKVCSPGGTTIAGLVALEEEAFMATVIKGLEATIQRDAELS